VFVADLAAPELEPADAHHLAQVLRLDDGDPVVAADGTGAFCPCRIEIARSTPAGAPRTRRPALVRLQRDGAIAETAAPDPPLGVGFALHKGERPEWAVQKLTELGIDRIITFTTERTVVRLDAAAARRRGDRLRRVAREAAAQCRRLTLPFVDDPVGYAEVLTRFGTGLAVAEPEAPPITAAMTCVLVGPEGGFTDGELARAPALVGLTDTVLRTETAAVTAGALLVAIRSGRLRPAVG
jgi:16S rRNA (uracil1498-N3)-methyltransferase